MFCIYKRIILFATIWYSFSYEFTEHNKDTNHDIKRRGIVLVQAAIAQLAETSSSLKTAYANNELQSAGNVALVLVEAVPVLGDIVYLLAEKPDSIFDIESGLTTINDNLKVLNTNIKNIGVRVDELAKKIDLSVIKNQVATDKREISNCYADLLLFLQNPIPKAEQDRIKNCYSKSAYIRQIGSILSNDKLTFMQNPIFDQIIDITGYCDWERIQDVYGFLLGIYIEGCTALITSEVLKYGNESITFKDECKTTIQGALHIQTQLFKNCKMDPCSKYVEVMINMLKSDPASDIKLQLQKSFPWFNFVIVSLRQGFSSGIALNNIRVFNLVTLSSSAVVNRVLIWSPDNNTGFSGQDRYGIEYKENKVESVFNGMNLLKTSKNGLTNMFGFRSNWSILESVCNRNFNTDDQTESDVASDIKDLLLSDHNVSLPGWAIALIVVVLIIAVVVGFCIYKKRYQG
ncbi:uncharacterized protein [Mytilus edulis]|uniref:uncharacterized protein n=1 Tax=Mytilus edulis TaxID=6550 RepID=UPI0039F0D004